MTDEADFVAKLQAIFREELEQDDLEISLNTAQKDIEAWDSLAHVRIVIGVERAFDIQFDVSEIESINSVPGFYEAVKRHLGL